MHQPSTPSTKTAAPVRRPTTSIQYVSPQMAAVLAEISLLAFTAEGKHAAETADRK